MKIAQKKSFGHVKRKHKKNKSQTPQKKPWFNENCHRARNQYHRARRRYNLNNTDENKNNLKQVSKFYKSTLHFSIKIFKEAGVQKLKNLKASNPKQFWNVLNSNNSNNACQASLNDLYNYFKTVSEYQDDSQKSISQDDIESNEELNKPISESEVRVAMKQLHNNKSAGLDNIKNEHIKCTSN